MPILRVGDVTGWAEPTLPPLPSLYFLTLDEMLSQNTSYCEDGIPRLVKASQKRKRAVAESLNLDVDAYIMGLDDAGGATHKRARFVESTATRKEDEAETKLMRCRVRAFLGRRDEDDKNLEARRLDLMRLSAKTKKEAKKDQGVTIKIQQYLTAELVDDTNARWQISTLTPSLGQQPLLELANTSGTSSSG